MCWAACETYWFALEDITFFLWHKLKNTKRINRRRRHRRPFQDFEMGYSSSDDSDFSDKYGNLNLNTKRKTARERRKDRLRSSLYHSSRHSSCHHHRHHGRLKTREVSVHVKGGSQGLWSSRHLQLSKVRNTHREAGIFKRRRLNQMIMIVSLVEHLRRCLNLKHY